MSLIERIEAAGPDRAWVWQDGLDVAAALGLDHTRIDDPPFIARIVSALNGSVDSALKLAGRVLPGWAWNICGPDRLVTDEHRAYALLAAPKMTGGPEPWGLDREVYEVRASTPALALVAAILRAKEVVG